MLRLRERLGTPGNGNGKRRMQEATYFEKLNLDEAGRGYSDDSPEWLRCFAVSLCPVVC